MQLTEDERAARNQVKREQHKASHTRLYRTWAHMKSRCHCVTDNGYANYGGRGITVCGEWRKSFTAFKKWAESSGYTEELEIDRRDNNGNYTPDNCRWATRVEQTGNMRKRVTSRRQYVGVEKRSETLFVLNITGRPCGKRYCGTFTTAEAAAREYDRIVSEEIPSRTFRNFPVTPLMERCGIEEGGK